MNLIPKDVEERVSRADRTRTLHVSEEGTSATLVSTNIAHKYNFMDNDSLRRVASPLHLSGEVM